MGATATGKSRLAIELAQQLGGEVVSMDSRQVYRGLDIGTAKVTAAERAMVPHHLLDYLDIDESGSAGRHCTMAETTIREIAARARIPLLVGGTGLYFRALFGGLVPVTIEREALLRIRAAFAGRTTAELYHELARVDPGRAGVLAPNDRVRITRALELFAHTGRPPSEIYARPHGGAPDIVYLKLVLTMPRALLRKHIAERTCDLFALGWVEEVRGLIAGGVDPTAPGMRSLGYGEIATALACGEDPSLCLPAVITLTRQYAKRQETFFRSVADAVWIDVTDRDANARARALAGAFVATAEPH